MYKNSLALKTVPKRKYSNFDKLIWVDVNRMYSFVMVCPMLLFDLILCVGSRANSGNSSSFSNILLTRQMKMAHRLSHIFKAIEHRKIFAQTNKLNIQIVYVEMKCLCFMLCSIPLSFRKSFSTNVIVHLL